MKKGFTLIELMIVIGIMMLLTVIAVGNFVGVQRQARVDFAADSLVAAIREQQVYAKSGRVIGGGSPGSFKNQCFALKFKQWPDGGMWAGQSDYVGIPTGTEQIDTCKILDDSGWQKRDIFDSGIQLLHLKRLGSPADIPEEKIYFKPPFAQVHEENGPAMQLLSNDVFDFEIGLPDDATARKKVEYNVATGEVKKLVN